MAIERTPEDVERFQSDMRRIASSSPMTPARRAAERLHPYERQTPKGVTDFMREQVTAIIEAEYREVVEALAMFLDVMDPPASVAAMSALRPTLADVEKKARSALDKSALGGER